MAKYEVGDQSPDPSLEEVGESSELLLYAEEAALRAEDRSLRGNAAAEAAAGDAAAATVAAVAEEGVAGVEGGP